MDGPDLAGRYRVLSGPLRHRHFEVFNLLVRLVGVETPLPVQFTHDFDGDLTALLCRLEPSVDPIRFERVTDDAHLTDDVLDGLAGTYRLGLLSATVTRRGERGLAAAAVAEAPPTALELVHDLVFTADGSRVEFADGWRLVTASCEFIRD